MNDHRDRATLWIGRERYFLIDADGKAEIHGYHQRPTAERRALQGGYGLYDRRENKLVIPIDYEKRVQRHKDDVAPEAPRVPGGSRSGRWRS